MKFIVLGLLLPVCASAKTLYICDMEILSRDYSKMSTEYIKLKVEKKWLFRAKSEAIFEFITVWGSSQRQLLTKKARRFRFFGKETLKVKAEKGGIKSAEDFSLKLKFNTKNVQEIEGYQAVTGIKGVVRLQDIINEDDIETFDIVEENSVCYLNPTEDTAAE